MKKKLYIALFILVPLTVAAGNYPSFIEQLFQYLNFYNKNYPQEKIYIQTDKTFYKQNERIWYKAFLLNSKDNRVSDISDVIYVELHDPKGNVIAKHEHNALNGVSSGEFLVGQEAAGGLYTLVAYTNWQKNWGEEAFFKKELTVQKVITPRLLLKLDFEKRAYGAGDDGVAILSVTDLQNVKTDGSRVKAEVKIGGITVQTVETATANGEARIAFHLPENLNTSDGLLQVVVKDKGVEESVSRSIPIVLNKISLQFFPEGGELIENVSGKVAFEALNEFGKGADVSGKIIDENDTEVAVFESFHLGMGAFEFTPQADKTYFAVIEKPQGKYAPVRLSQAKKSGYSLNLKSKNKNSLLFSIYALESNRVSFTGQTQGIIYFGKEINLKKGYNSVEIDLKDFPIGIAVFTLFDENKRETCERLVYVNPQNGLQVNLTTDKEFYEPLEDVKLSIKTTDKNNRPVSASLGISVVDEQLLALADDKQDNILSYLLFSSELKGKIQEPSFYFDKNEPKANEAIDYLMLTHGWRRFTWQEILHPQKIEMKEPSEKVSDIYGYVLDKKGKSKQRIIYLIEYDGKRRVAKLKTTPNGQFAFHNVDFSGNVLIVAPYSDSIYLLKGKPQIFDADFLTAKGLTIFESTSGIQVPQEKTAQDTIFRKNPDNFNELLFGNDDALNEVVVTAFGAQKRSALTGSVSSVQPDILRLNDISTALQGRVAGVVMQNINDAGNKQNLSVVIRGNSSSSGNMQPLYVLDGVPLLSGNALSDLIRSEDIYNIEILKSPAAMAIYGSRAANGVVLISTYNYPYGFRAVKNKPEYSGLFVPKREFYSAVKFTQNIHNHNNENTTVYWNANVSTDKNGEASLSFKNNNISSSFRITAEGVSTATGLIGNNIHKIATIKPFSVDVKTPLFASLGDTVRLPVLLRNTTKETIKAKVNLLLPKALLPINAQELDVTITPESTQTVYMGFMPTYAQGEHEYTITALTEDGLEEITRTITVRSVYFPQSQSFSGRKSEDAFSFRKAGEIVDGSFHAELVCYTNIRDELFAGLSSILREPYGCFEQVSSSNYPNIMALQAMEASGETVESTKRRALDLLDKGYKQLAAYEISGGGFDWYGKPPASTVLTAYGILQFNEMAKVYDKVNAKMTERARNFLLDRCDGKGNFENKGLRYAFSETSQEVCNAYVIYALTETNEKTDIDKEYQKALQEAFDSKDMYRMALMANAAYNRDDRENYNKLVAGFEKEIKNGDFDKLKMQTSITCSKGKSLTIETVALWTIALLKTDNQIKTGLIEQCIDFISSRRSSYGGFGNTQSTILCLQAMANYAKTGNPLEQGALKLAINGKTAHFDLTKKSEEEKQMSFNITNLFKQGDNNIELQFVNMQKSVPYNIQLTWEYKTPANSDLCPLRLTTKLNRTTVKRNETVRLSVTLENKSAEGLPMNIAIIGIPGGMSLQAWQLKEMQEQEVFDFYEIINDNLVIYYRSMQPKERKTINLDLKAEISGTYTGMASTTYVYYTNENKYWVKGLTVKIEE